MLPKLLLIIFAVAAIVLSYQFTPSLTGTPTSNVVAPSGFTEPSYSSSLSLIPASSFPEESPSPATAPSPKPTSLLTRLLSPFLSNSLSEIPTIPAVSSPVTETPTSAAPVPSALSFPRKRESIPSTPIDATVIFNKLWPDYYRASLSDTRDFLTSRGYLSANQNYSLDSESSIWIFLNDYAAAYKNIASLSDADYVKLKDDLSAAPALKAEQRQEIIGDLSFSFRRLLVNLFGAPVARASWVSSAGGGLCYRDDAPGNLAVGPSSPAVSCNSGLWCDEHCSFRADCGPYAASCNVHFGCLNQTCRGFANALYDPATSMCGCG